MAHDAGQWAAGAKAPGSSSEPAAPSLLQLLDERGPYYDAAFAAQWGCLSHSIRDYITGNGADLLIPEAGHGWITHPHHPFQVMQCSETASFASRVPLFAVSTPQVHE
jgi:hypothetical protein